MFVLLRNTRDLNRQCLNVAGIFWFAKMLRNRQKLAQTITL